MRADAVASTTSHPAFVTTRDRPSCRNGMAAVKHLIWDFGKSEFYPSCQFVASRRVSACGSVCWIGNDDSMKGRLKELFNRFVTIFLPATQQRRCDLPATRAVNS
jgi:hypothetical protein